MFEHAPKLSIREQEAKINETISDDHAELRSAEEIVGRSAR